MTKRDWVGLLALFGAGAWSEQARDHCTDIWAGELSKSCMAMLDQRHLDEDVRHSRPPKAAEHPGFSTTPTADGRRFPTSTDSSGAMDKLGREHWLDEEGAEHWIEWGGREWILLPVGAPFPDDLEHVRVFARTTGEHAGEDDLSASGDFDGDGALDVAFFMRVGDGYALAVSLGWADLVHLEEVDSIARLGIATAPPGTYIAACAKGYGDDCAEGAEGELRKVTTTRDAFTLFQYESSSALYFLRDGRFEKMWLSG